MTCVRVCVLDALVTFLPKKSNNNEKLAWPITVHCLLVVEGEHDRLLQIKCHLAIVSWMRLMLTLFLSWFSSLFIFTFSRLSSLLTYLMVIRRKYNLFVFIYGFWGALNDAKMKVSFQDMSRFSQWKSQLLFDYCLGNGFSFS